MDGITFFAKHKMVEVDDDGKPTPEGVAKFFHEMRGLNKNEIGQFVGRSKAFNKKAGGEGRLQTVLIDV